MSYKTMTALVAFLLVGFVAFSASAKDMTPEQRETARKLYNKATQSYDHGDYKDALEFWTETYDISGNPIVLYSIGNANERLGNLQDAIKALNGYKKSVSGKEDKEVLDMRITNLKERYKAQQEAQQLKEEKRARERADAEAREAALKRKQNALAEQLNAERLKEIRKDPKGLLAVRWLSISLAGAGIITGAAFQIIDNGTRTGLTGNCANLSGSNYLCTEDQHDALRKHQRNEKAAKIAYGIAGGFGVLGISLLFVHPNRDKGLSDLALEPVFYSDGGGARLRMNF